MIVKSQGYKKRRVTIKANPWTIYQQNLWPGTKNYERRLVMVGTTMVSGTQATERRAKNTAGGGLCGVRRAITCFAPAVKTLLGHSSGVPIDLSTPEVFCLSSTRHRKVVQNPQATERGWGEVVVKPNTAGGSMGRARFRHRKAVQNPHSVQANTHDYFLRDLRLVGSTRHRKAAQT